MSMLSSEVGNGKESKVVIGFVGCDDRVISRLVGEGGLCVTENTVIDDCSGPDALGCEAARLALGGRPAGLG